MNNIKSKWFQHPKQISLILKSPNHPRLTATTSISTTLGPTSTSFNLNSQTKRMLPPLVRPRKYISKNLRQKQELHKTPNKSLMISSALSLKDSRTRRGTSRLVRNQQQRSTMTINPPLQPPKRLLLIIPTNSLKSYLTRSLLHRMMTPKAHQASFRRGSGRTGTRSKPSKWLSRDLVEIGLRTTRNYLLNSLVWTNNKFTSGAGTKPKRGGSSPIWERVRSNKLPSLSALTSSEATANLGFLKECHLLHKL